MTPTVGRVVWFYKYVTGAGHKGPLAAHIAKVHSTELVNLMVINEDGFPCGETSVKFLAEGSDAPNDSPKSDYCCWMPYQVSKAKAGDHNSESAEPRPG